MKKVTYIILLMLLGIKSIYSQVNLVPNGDFELYSTLPNGLYQCNRAVGWNNINGHYIGPPYGSPDYYYNPNFMSSYYGTITPYSGNGQMAVMIYDKNVANAREYISTHLTSKMVQGCKYSVSLYITNGTSSVTSVGCNNLGVYFSKDTLTQSLLEPILVTPQIKINSIIYYWNTWHHFSFNFIATDTFKIITIGNFYNDANTLISVTGINEAYYYIDKIEVYPYGINIKGDSAICSGGISILKTVGDSIVKWANILNPGNIIAIDSIITISPLITTTYIAFNSTDTAYFTVHVNPNPIVNLGNDTTLCIGNILSLNAANTGSIFQWNTYATSQQISVIASGTYWVKATNNYGCVDLDTIKVTFLDLNVDIGNDTSICKDDTLLLNAGNIGSLYSWSTGATTQQIKVWDAGTYWVQIVNGNCSSIDTIHITVDQRPTVNLGNDTIMCSGNLIVLNAGSGFTGYLWSTGSTQSFINVNDPGTYSVTVFNGDCKASDVIKIEECNSEIWIPNVFTPNDDGLNDYFFAVTTNINNMTMYIFNRWGNQIFKGEGKEVKWNGKYIDKTCPVGVYYYLLEYEYSLNGIVKKKQLHGSVTLLK